jgi:hypothetical protein
MTEQKNHGFDRRSLLTQLVPACSLVYLASGSLLALAGTEQETPPDTATHKFDVKSSLEMSTMQRVAMQNRSFIGFIKTLQQEMDSKELLRLLNLYSAEVGRQVGAGQARNAPDTSFQTFVSTFRPPNFASALTHEIVTDTEKVFELRVTECVWASVFRDAGLGGEIGHAAVCNMDYYWPPAFHQSFKMERDKTLMQGHDCCNHRYLDTST